MEFIAGLITGYLANWFALAGLITLVILFEHNEARGWAIFTAIIVAIVSYFFFKVDWQTIVVGAGIYVLVGVVWSFWRYKRWVETKVAALKNRSKEIDKYDLQRLQPNENLDTIVAWIIIWPFSAIENLTADIINGIERLVTTVFRTVYTKIYESATSGLSVKQ